MLTAPNKLAVASQTGKVFNFKKVSRQNQEEFRAVLAHSEHPNTVLRGAEEKTGLLALVVTTV